MGKVVNIITRAPVIADNQDMGDNLRHGDGNGGGDDMLVRIKKLEDDMQVIKTDISVIKSNYATKSDVSEAKFSIIAWVVGAIFLAQLLPPIISAIKA